MSSPRATTRAMAAEPAADWTPSPAQLARAAAEREAEAAAVAHIVPPRLGPAPEGARDDRPLPGLGRPLPPGLRGRAERRLGADLSAVRLHDDPAARQVLSEHGARGMARGAGIALRPEDARADTPDRARLMDHELAHVAQQARPGAAPQTQCEDEDPRGPGRSPPEARFTTMQTVGAEDDHALFPHDSADLAPAAVSRLAAAATGDGPLVVHVHGYASREGPERYNLNLSAHRAVAVRDALAPLLPEGTRFVLHAHGETDAFGEAADNRRAGVDFIREGDGSFLGGTGPLSLFPRPRRLSLFEPGELALDRPALDPDAPAPEFPDLDAILPDTGFEAVLPVSPDPDPAFDFTQPAPDVFAGDDYDFSAVAPEFSIRGVPLDTRYADGITSHYEVWRERFFRLGLPPEAAIWAAQTGTDLMVGTHLSLEAPTRFEEFDRRFGTEPTTITVLDETRMMWIYERARRLFGGGQ